MIEASYTCLFCHMDNLTIIEPLEGHQSYVEDCQTCCNPLQFEVEVCSGSLVSLEIVSLEQ